MRGLLAIEPLYNKIVAGEKTQTRRSGGLEIVNENPDNWLLNGRFTHTKETIKVINGDGLVPCSYLFETNTAEVKLWCKPRYKVGEVLYLKEPIYMQGKNPVKKSNGDFIYKYGGNDTNLNGAVYGPIDGSKVGWSNKLSMPASAARAFVKITSIKCERLLDISDQDCIAEGIEKEPNMSVLAWKIYDKKYHGLYTDNPKASFYSLFQFANKINKNEPIVNIWVWVYSFEYLPNFKP